MKSGTRLNLLLKNLLLKKRHASQEKATSWTVVAAARYIAVFQHLVYDQVSGLKQTESYHHISLDSSAFSFQVTQCRGSSSDPFEEKPGT